MAVASAVPLGVVAPDAAQRSADARLARVHLRGGLLPLARAALEQMAGAGTLDREAFADLAEVRWRSGDLEGAAEAGHAHLGTGGDEPTVHLVLAEEHARGNRMAEAQGHAAAVYVRVGPAIDLYFAGEQRAPVWPPPEEGWMDSRAATPGRWGLLVGGAEIMSASVTTWAAVPLAQAGLVSAAVVGSDASAPALLPEPPPVRAPGPPSTTAALLTGRAAGEELDVAERADGRRSSGAGGRTPGGPAAPRSRARARHPLALRIGRQKAWRREHPACPRSTSSVATRCAISGARTRRSPPIRWPTRRSPAGRSSRRSRERTDADPHQA